MEFIVNKDEIILKEDSKVHKGEYNATELIFTFSEEYNDLIKKAIFENKTESIEVNIVNNKCNIPSTMIESTENKFNLRVYGYIEENGNLIIRYSPAYITIPIYPGSYKGGAIPIPTIQELKDVSYTENGEYSVVPDEGYDGIAKTNISIDVQPSLETKSETITENGDYTYTPSTDYYGMSEVGINVNVQPSLETKNVNITQNGTSTVQTSQGYYGMSDVNLSVNVQPLLEEKSINPTTSSQEITSDEGYYGLSKVTVSAVTSSIDNNIVAGNIKKDISILGVLGTLEEGIEGVYKVSSYNEMLEISNPQVDDFCIIYTNDEKIGFYQYNGNEWEDIVALPGVLPKNYTQLSWIKSTGTQYIQTNIKPNQDTRVIMEVQNAGNSAFFFGCWDYGYDSNVYAISNDNAAIYMGYQNQVNTYSPILSTATHIIDFNKNIISVDNNVIQQFNYANFQLNQRTMTLCCIQQASKIMFGKDTFELKGCKIYNNNVLVKDYTPCIRKLDNAVGLYDFVNSEFCANAGSGTFVYGE